MSAVTYMIIASVVVFAGLVGQVFVFFGDKHNLSGKFKAAMKVLTPSSRMTLVPHKKVPKEEVAYDAGKEFFCSHDVHMHIQGNPKLSGYVKGHQQYNMKNVMEQVLMNYPDAWILADLRQDATLISPILEHQYEQHFWKGVFDHFYEIYGPKQEQEKYQSDDAITKSLQWTESYQNAIREIR